MGASHLRAEDIQGWMDDAELAWLREKASVMRSIAEIGCWKGRSTHALLSSCLGLVYAVDHFQGSPDEVETRGHREARQSLIKNAFQKNVGHFSNLRMIERDSVAAAGMFQEGELDMVFIDASHAYLDVSADIRAWRSKARLLLAGHDFCGGWPGVVQAVTEQFSPDVKRGPGSIWYAEVQG